MPRIPDETIDLIKARADIVELISEVTPVKKRGNDYWACCPFHHEKTPSFKIDPQRQNFYCFGCKKSGNIFTFVKETVNTDFVGAVRWLANRLGITIPEQDNGNPADATRRRQWKDNCMRLLNDTAVWFHDNLRRPEAAPAVHYINSRELDNAAVDQFMLGYSPDSWDALITWAQRQGYSLDMLIATGLAVQKDNSNSCYDRFRGRLTFPIWNELGQVVGFSARLLDPNPKMAKYVNSPETDFFQKGQLLYAYNFARKSFQSAGRALICEGQLDVIACHRAGLTHAIASQGTAFTEYHARLLKRSTNTVTLAFDADSAGQHATVRTIAILHGAGLTVDVVTLPDGQDPDSIFRTGGAEALKIIMDNRAPALQYLLESFRHSHDLNVPSERSEVAQQLIEAIKPIPDPVTQASHYQWLAREMNIPEHILMDEVNMIQKRDQHRATRAPMTSPQQQPQPQPFQTPSMQTLFQPARQNPYTGHPVGRPMPAFTMPVPNENLFQCLLQLILCFQPFAAEIAQDTTISQLLPDTPLGHAISHVLALNDEGEWDIAESDLANSQLSEYPAVGRVLAANDFRSLLPLDSDTQEQKDDKMEKLDQAFDDCLGRIFTIELNRKITELRQQLSSAPQEQQSELQQQLFELIKRKSEYKRR